MDFGLTDDQHEIQRTARELLGRRARRCERVREAAEAGRYDDALWRELVRARLARHRRRRGARRPGARRRRARDPARGARLRAAPSTPFLPTVLAAAVIEHGGSRRAARALAARAWRAASSRRARHRARRRGELVADGAGADVLVLVDGDGAALVAARATPRSSRSPRSTRRAATRACAERGRRGAARRRGAGVDRAHGRGRRRARRRLPARAGDDARLRQGAQAVRHAGRRLPGGLAPLRADAAATPRARARRRTSPPGRRTPTRSGSREAAAMAKAAASDAGREVTAAAIQAHGGIGFTWEADVHWLYKRAQLDAPCWAARGRPRAAGAHRGRAAARAGDGLAAGPAAAAPAAAGRRAAAGAAGGRGAGVRPAGLRGRGLVATMSEAPSAPPRSPELRHAHRGRALVDEQVRVHRLAQALAPSARRSGCRARRRGRPPRGRAGSPRRRAGGDRLQAALDEVLGHLVAVAQRALPDAGGQAVAALLLHELEEHGLLALLVRSRALASIAPRPA